MAFMISWVCVALFNVSMLSGLVVAFVYKPSMAYESVQTMTYLIPYGKFFRELHYFSSEAFILFTLLHVILEMIKPHIRIKAFSWHYSVLALLLMFALMFTGYVLKSDLSGFSAGEIAISLIKQTPLLEYILPWIEDKSLFFWKFYIWHILFLPLVLSYAIYKHIDTLKTRYFIIGIGLTLLAMLFFSLPKDVAYHANTTQIHGPWFFWGAENMLAAGIKVWIVDLMILLPFVFLSLYYELTQKRYAIGLLFVWLWVYAYYSSL